MFIGLRDVTFILTEKYFRKLKRYHRLIWKKSVLILGPKENIYKLLKYNINF